MARINGKRIQATKNYPLFKRSIDNRPVNLQKHKELIASMKEYGYLEEWPIVVRSDGNGRFIVREGQHRLAVAEQLGLPVFYVETDKDLDIAKINSTQKVWSVEDYVHRFAQAGVKDYQSGLEFADHYGLLVGPAFSLLAGVVSFGNIKPSIQSGKFRIREFEWADYVAKLYLELGGISECLRKTSVLQACMMMCRVAEFQSSRLIKNAKRRHRKIRNLSSRVDHLEQFEEIYNAGGLRAFGLKAAAIQAVRDRESSPKN